ncbi:MAG: hypothetical protein FWF33_03170, partial [Clostridiales bacterium]|nr:hypothetical protein [Clostridiales bacterium]
MDFREIKTYADGCLRDTPPPCAAVCPYGLDVRALIEAVRVGRWARAFRLYRDAVLFPRVVSALCPAPCMGACVLGLSPDNAPESPVQDGRMADTADAIPDAADPGTAENAGNSSIDLLLIEREIVARAVASGAAEPRGRYAIPKKGEAVRIERADLASLSEAFRFASKGYDVTVAYDGTLLPEARGLMPDAEIEADI